MIFGVRVVALIAAAAHENEQHAFDAITAVIPGDAEKFPDFDFRQR